MSNPIAGWYPDPSGDPNKLRYWDGASWTEHFAPVQPAATSVPERPVTDHATPTQELGAGTTQAFGDQPTGPGQPWTGGAQQAGQGQQAPYGQQQAPYGQAQQAPYGQQQQAPYGQGQQAPYGQQPGAGHSPYGAPGAGQSEGAGSGKGLVIGIIVAAVVLVAAAVIAVVLLLTGGEDDPAPGGTEPTPQSTTEPETDPETDEETEPETEPAEADPAPSGGDVALGSLVEGSFTADTPWVGTLRITEPSAVVLDVRSSADAVLTLTGPDLSLENDDRGSLAGAGDASSLDPLIATVLEPGEYEVEVDGWSSGTGDFTLEARSAERIDPGAGVDVVLDEGQMWVGSFEVAPDAGLMVDTVAAEGDAEMAVYGPDGFEERVDDSDEGAGAYRDPSIVLTEPGTYVIVLFEYWADPLDLELSATVQ